jgi:nucleoid DNA-binding protein
MASKKKKATAKKATAKAAPKKTTAKAAVAKPAKKDLNVRTSGFEKVSRSRSKGQVFRELCASTGLSRKELVNVFENLEALMKNDLTKGPGVFQLPGIVKVLLVKKKAVPARKGTNPFTGEEMMFKAKPARNVVRARPLKGLKDMVK